MKKIFYSLLAFAAMASCTESGGGDIDVATTRAVSYGVDSPAVIDITAAKSVVSVSGGSLTTQWSDGDQLGGWSSEGLYAFDEKSVDEAQAVSSARFESSISSSVTKLRLFSPYASSVSLVDGCYPLDLGSQIVNSASPYSNVGDYSVMISDEFGVELFDNTSMRHLGSFVNLAFAMSDFGRVVDGEVVSAEIVGLASQGALNISGGALQSVERAPIVVTFDGALSMDRESFAIPVAALPLDFAQGDSLSVNINYKSAGKMESKRFVYNFEDSFSLGSAIYHQFTLKPVAPADLELVNGVYQLYSASDLMMFAQKVNEGEGDIDAKLMSDINLASVCGASLGNWTPIGAQEGSEYRGTFDGADHKIRGLYIKDMMGRMQGLFGYVDGGVIKNLDLFGSVSSFGISGGFAGYIKGEIINCINYVTINGDGNEFGGIAGRVGDGSKVVNCRNMMPVKGASLVGGIAGSVGAGSDLVACLNNKTITHGTATSVVWGGIVGDHGDSTKLIGCLDMASDVVSGSADTLGVVDSYASTDVETFDTYVVWRMNKALYRWNKDNGRVLKHHYKFAAERSPEVVAGEPDDAAYVPPVVAEVPNYGPNELAASAMLTSIKEYVTGAKTLTNAQIIDLNTEVKSRVKLISGNKFLLAEAFDAIDGYESSSKFGPLFLNAATKGGFARTSISSKAIHFVMLELQQGLVDYAYTPKNLKDFSAVLYNAKYKTSSFFPGAVAAPADSTVSYKVQISASNAKSWGAPTSNETVAAKRPTGCYLAPGSIAKVIVPPSMVGCGFNVRVGAHSWDLVKKPSIKRLDRVSLVYPITESETLIGSPLGGGIYIEVPYLKDLGVVEIEIVNAVRSPFFSTRSFDKMTNAEWKASERNNPGPWADFESEDFMMQVPTDWIYKMDDPTTTMAEWDKGMAAVFETRGLDPARFDKTMLYMQIDVQMRGSANFPGYPQSNYGYNPLTKMNGTSTYWMLKGPKYADWTVLHELGHSISITKFRGETEAIVNFINTIVWNKTCGYSLDVAFSLSIGSNKKQITLNQVAMSWMTTENFQNGKEMNYSNVAGDEFKYQHRGFAKYIDFVKLYGWDAMDKFWYDANVDYMGAKKYYPADVNKDPVDSRILHMSMAAGEDITPLIHFWGIHPVNAAKLKQSIAAAGLKPSAKIYDRLQECLTLIPKDNAAFQKHARTIYPGKFNVGPNTTLLTGEGWYSVWFTKYNTTHYDKAVASLQKIINLYYPSGRP